MKRLPKNSEFWTRTESAPPEFLYSMYKLKKLAGVSKLYGEENIMNNYIKATAIAYKIWCMTGGKIFVNPEKIPENGLSELFKESFEKLKNTIRIVQWLNILKMSLTTTQSSLKTP